jgi:peroxiredoxin
MKKLTIICLLFVFAAVNAQRNSPIAVGEAAPDFTLEDQNGRKVTLSDSRSKNPVVLVFYRAYWWPYCARQLAELRSLLKKDENVKIYALSGDSQEASKTLAEKIASDGKGALNFPLLSDPQHKIIDAYGLRDEAYKGQDVYGIPHPAVYIINKEGKVSWVRIEADYKQRPTNAEIRAALAALK